MRVAVAEIGVPGATRPFRVTRSPLDEPGFEIRRLCSGLFALKLWGRFQPGWAGNVADGLAAAGINIVSLFARKLGSLSWLAEFELDAARGSDPLFVDYLELAARPVPAGAPAPIVCDDCAVGASSKHGGSLYVELGGADQLGFLGSLLRRLAHLSLFPEELTIETREGRIQDRVFVKSIGGAAPSEAQRLAVKSALERLLPRPR